MRKFQQVALVVAAASGLSAIGAGSAIGATPVTYNGAVPPPATQPDAQAASMTNSQASVQTSGSSTPQQAAPQRPAEVSPQVSPQLNPQISPELSSQPPQAQGQGQAQAQAQGQNQHNLFRPYQECSPQSLLDANLPVALLAAAETRGVDCTQANSQANAAASAQS
ncbi:hypothetical protein OG453_04570 [Streptomyces sp. NBC_01381]|uniref:hypothetical protein n=1 Tax=Streptomyces sp. NBC_01381 TaxID=2903845 RepID=UPI00225511EB|nr:hypothetical protein [Streptomyces sp. NBC_01381]MCX4665952.1 hypothetical protein [Streptomyces sp. NBC_01381]